MPIVEGLALVTSRELLILAYGILFTSKWAFESRRWRVSTGEPGKLFKWEIQNFDSNGSESVNTSTDLQQVIKTKCHVTWVYPL